MKPYYTFSFQLNLLSMISSECPYIKQNKQRKLVISLFNNLKDMNDVW